MKDISGSFDKNGDRNSRLDQIMYYIGNFIVMMEEGISIRKHTLKCFGVKCQDVYNSPSNG